MSSKKLFSGGGVRVKDITTYRPEDLPALKFQSPVSKSTGGKYGSTYGIQRHEEIDVGAFGSAAGTPEGRKGQGAY